MIHHGGRLEALRARFPDAPEPLIDLSTGINPFPYPIPEIPAEAYTRLPEDGQIQRLKEAAATAYGCPDPSLVAVAPGTQILISSLPRVLPSAQVAIVSPTYAEHAAAWKSGGVAVTEIETLDAAPAAGALVLCNPNNPDGGRYTAQELVELQEQRAQANGTLIVDEAFAEFDAADVSCAPAAAQPGLVLLRSFGKAYGLAGVRLGFLIGEPAVVKQVEATLGPWPISGAAIHIARAAFEDHDWRREMGNRLTREAAALDALLLSRGLTLVGGTSLFRLSQHEAATLIANDLAQAGILVRDFPENPAWLRFGLPPDEAAWQRLREALPAD